jgi:hypothetical protein
MANKLWNTGVDDNGILLPGKSIDPHWKLVRGPGVTHAPQNVYVLIDQKVGNYVTTSDSRWVWADPSGKGDPTSPYVFQTKFYLEIDLSEHWIQINGTWAADNFGELRIDGLLLPPGSGNGAIFLPPGDVVDNYQKAHDFSILQTHPFSLSHLRLDIGWHTFEVWVNNEDPSGPDNPAGLNVSALGIAINPVRHIPAVHPGP